MEENVIVTEEVVETTGVVEQSIGGPELDSQGNEVEIPTEAPVNEEVVAEAIAEPTVEEPSTVIDPEA